MSTRTPPRALVVGLGASGVAAATLLSREGWRVVINDREREDRLAPHLASLPPEVETQLGSHPVNLVADVGLVVVSPGVPWNLPLLGAARANGVEVIGEVELAWRHLRGTPLVGVTGSNGKSTVTAMIGAILRADGRKVAVGANLGTPATALAIDPSWDAHVWELSSFQLEGCTTLRPRVGVLLNVSADHLDRHSGLDAYLAAKARLFVHQTADDDAVLNADDPLVQRLALSSRRSTFSLRLDTTDGRLADDNLMVDGRPLLRRDELPLLGDHNVANSLAAALAAARVGVASETIAHALGSFPGLPHRHQLVAEAGGIRWIDDSKATNIGATAAGLAGYPPATVHIILGGLGKGQDFTELRQTVSGPVSRVYLIGEAAGAIAAALGDIIPIEQCGTLDRAVECAAARSRPGDTVLLSPACASFDQFRDYGHRGDEFRRLAGAASGGS